MEYHLVTCNSNHSRCNIFMFIITITFHSPITTMKKLHQVSHYSGEMAIRIDCNQLGIIPNINLGLPAMIALVHLWCNSGTHFAGSISATQPGTTRCQDGQDYPTLGLMSSSPHILTTIQSAHSNRTGPA